MTAMIQHNDPRVNEARRRLAAVRRELGNLSYRAFAERIAACGRRLGVNLAARREKTFRWEHWGVTPDQATQRVLATLLGIPESNLIANKWPYWLPNPHVSPTADPLRDAVDQSDERTLRALVAQLVTTVHAPGPIPPVGAQLCTCGTVLADCACRVLISAVLGVPR